jgi:hypothetical protein
MAGLQKLVLPPVRLWLLARTICLKNAGHRRSLGSPDYSIDEVTHVPTVNVEGSTFPNFTGGTQTRILSFDGDEVTYFNPTPSMGGSAKVTYRRAK